MYDLGLFVQRDYAEAVKWLLKAAEQNDGRAQYNLGVMYANGLGVEKDYVQAYAWCNLVPKKPSKNNCHISDGCAILRAWPLT